MPGCSPPARPCASRIPPARAAMASAAPTRQMPPHSAGRMRKTAVLNVVGLTAGLIARGAPTIAEWARGAAAARVHAAFPAVTCTAQSDYLTGRYADSHGIVGNGWYVREDCEVKFWRQSNR